MNQRGEATLFGILILVVLTGILGLCALRLQRSFSLLKKRTELFLCVKETKGELKRHLSVMGQTNWALVNTSRAQLIMMLIPGLQGVALNADKIKRALKVLQRAELGRYFLALARLRHKGCPMDPRLMLSAFQLNGGDFKRGPDHRALLRKNSWNYHFISPPYGLTLHFQGARIEAIKPNIEVRAEEIGGKFSSLLFSR